jgi:DNA-binding MurR/RpiR family transcriptional regulator
VNQLDSNVCSVATVGERIVDDGSALTPAERRVGQVILDDPEVVAFGTVADLAGRAGTSGATVVRFAERIGYRGFVGLQAAVQDEMARRLRPATERIRRPSPSPTDIAARTLAVELENLQATLGRVDRDAFDRAVALLAARRASVWVLSGQASLGVATMMAGELAMLRPGVELVTGPPVAVAGALAHVGPDDVVVAIDLPRYDRWLVDAVRRVRSTGAKVVAVTDSRLSPLAEGAAAALAVAAEGAGPFDSHVGVLGLANALVNGVATRLRASATRRLDRVEAAWRDAGALSDR